MNSGMIPSKRVLNMIIEWPQLVLFNYIYVMSEEPSIHESAFMLLLKQPEKKCSYKTKPYAVPDSKTGLSMVLNEDS